jgi:hypothetical protein
LSDYSLVLINVRAEEDLTRRIMARLRGLEGLVLIPGVIITWRPRDNIESHMSRLKDYILGLMRRGSAVEFTYAILTLTGDQFNQVRPMVLRRLEHECTRMIRRGEVLLRKLRSGSGSRDELSRYRRDLERLVRIHGGLGVDSEGLRKLMELYREFFKR